MTRLCAPMNVHGDQPPIFGENISSPREGPPGLDHMTDHIEIEFHDGVRGVYVVWIPAEIPGAEYLFRCFDGFERRHQRKKRIDV